MSDAAYENKPQHLVFENGEFSVRVDATCDDLTWSQVVLAVMEAISKPQVLFEREGEHGLAR